MKDYPYRYPYGIRIRYKDERAVEILAEAIHESIREDTVILCIGTDRCIGDALGPIVGTLLVNKNFRLPVYGTLDTPIHAVNLEQSMAQIQALHSDAFFIAVDACLGDENAIGHIHIKKGPIFPGKGVGKKLPSVGDMSIIGIVDKVGNDDCFAIHNIRLSLIMKMAQIIADAFIMAAYLS